MASFFAHPAFPVALKMGSSRPVPKKLFILCLILTCLPDADVVAFKFGVPYESQWGHRGFTHSIIFSIALGLICQFYHEKLGASKARVFWWTFLSLMSHSVMDAFTNGGLGVALLWPFSSERFFSPIRPVEVSPIGVWGFLGLRGVIVVLNEIICLWVPLVLMSTFVRYCRQKLARQKPSV